MADRSIATREALIGTVVFSPRVKAAIHEWEVPNGDTALRSCPVGGIMDDVVVGSLQRTFIPEPRGG
jgi:hypothetical protein